MMSKLGISLFMPGIALASLLQSISASFCWVSPGKNP
jgi:hypothetical protein